MEVQEHVGSLSLFVDSIQFSGKEVVGWVGFLNQHTWARHIDVFKSIHILDLEL